MKLKIAIVGPKASGKSQITNFLGGQAESPVSDRYEPTVGVRIIETEFSSNNNQHIQIELWDASGDHRYEACWKAIMHEADGVIIIYNPDAPSQDQQLMDWFEFFVKKNNLKEEQCLIFAHRVNPTTERFRPPPLFAKVAASVTGPSSANDMKNMFENFVKEISTLRMRK